MSLTYDDALPIHHQYVAPALEARGINGTFYVLISGDPLQNVEKWKAVASRGHELGNHSLFHPCRREPPEQYSWLDAGFDLRSYTPERFRLELRVANFVLYLLDGKQLRTYGNTCSETYIGDGKNRRSMDDLLRTDFVAARGAFTSQMVSVSKDLNLMNVGHATADFRSFDDLHDEIARARKSGAWLVYMIHGVGPETKELYIERDVHERLLDYLAGETDIWTQPFISVALYVREWQEGLVRAR